MRLLSCQGMPNFDSFLIARVSRNMATQDKKDASVKLTHSSSDNTFSQLQLQGTTDNVTTKSAFEITSVSDSNNIEGEDNEGATVNTNDADEMKNLIRKGEKESNRLSSSSGESETAVVDSQNKIDHMTGETHGNFPVNPSPKPQDTITGPLVGGLSRFRKINHYPRGRWIVRDTYEPEERPESAITPDIPTGNSPLQVRKNPPPPSSLTTSEYSYDSRLQHSRSNSEASFVTDQHISYPLRGDIGSERSSVIADTCPSLSRTESNSSLITKSLDEECDHESRSRDVDLESVVSIPNTHTPDLQSNSTTYNSIERPLQKHCDICSRRNIQELPVEEQCHAVEITMDLLKDQLTQLLHHNSPYQSLLKDNRELLKENTRLKERIKELEVANSNGNHDGSGNKGDMINHSTPH